MRRISGMRTYVRGSFFYFASGTVFENEKRKVTVTESESPP